MPAGSPRRSAPVARISRVGARAQPRAALARHDRRRRRRAGGCLGPRRRFVAAAALRAGAWAVLADPVTAASPRRRWSTPAPRDRRRSCGPETVFGLSGASAPVLSLRGWRAEPQARSRRRGRVVRLHPPRAARHDGRPRDGRLRAGHRPRTGQRRRRRDRRAAAPDRRACRDGRVRRGCRRTPTSRAATRWSSSGPAPASPAIGEWVAATGMTAGELVDRRRAARGAGASSHERRTAHASTSTPSRPTSRPSGRASRPPELMLVVKDDAYGHGLETDRRARPRRGRRLVRGVRRPAGVAARAAVGAGRAHLLVADGRRRRDRAGARRRHRSRAWATHGFLDDVAAVAAARGRVARVHLKIDTGLHRNGIRPEDWPAALRRAARATKTPARSASSASGATSRRRATRRTTPRAAAFDAAVAAAEDARSRHRGAPPRRQRGILRRPEFRYDLVRVGAFCYGIRSAGGPAEQELGIRPIASLTARVVRVEGDDAVARHRIPATACRRSSPGA